MKQIFVVGALIFALSGCASVSDLPPGYAPSAQDAEGLAVFSLTLSGKDLSRVSSFEYRVRKATSASGKEVERRPYFDSALQHARWVVDDDAQGPAAKRIKLIVKSPALAEPLDVIESGRPVGRVAALRLPAGDYELYDWKIRVPNQYGGDEFGPKRAMTYRFRIEAGRVAYLGNVDLRMIEQDMYNITVENRAKRDLALLARKLPVTSEDILVRPGELRP